MNSIQRVFQICSLATALFLSLGNSGWGRAQAAPAVQRINADMEVEQVAANCYVVHSFATVPPWGRIPGNEMLYIAGPQALLVNTPWNDRQTAQLLDWTRATLKVQVVKAILTHTHDDCMGGIGVLTNRHIQTIALDKTARKARQEGKPVPETTFSDSLLVSLGNLQAEAFYPGAGHTVDNITVWFPREKILFGGCLVKSAQSQDLGNIADADLSAWPDSLRRLRARYPQAVLVVPGHGKASGLEAIDHSLDLLAQPARKP